MSKGWLYGTNVQMYKCLSNIGQKLERIRSSIRKEQKELVLEVRLIKDVSQGFKRVLNSHLDFFKH